MTLQLGTGRTAWSGQFQCRLSWVGVHVPRTVPYSNVVA
jgi:hypothetical protein